MVVDRGGAALRFLGACERVTGSCTLLRVGGRQVLIDCGLVQGSEEDEQLNAAAFPFDPRQIDAVLLTHAHLDHAGRLPLLVREGFRGRIYTHRASRDLARILLRDAAYLNEMDAAIETRKRARRGEPAVEPLYTQADATRCLRHFRGVDYEQPIPVVPGLSVRFRDAGHILGAAFLEAEVTQADRRWRLCFSGDLGQGVSPLMPPPQSPGAADLMILESTYGDRRHQPWDETLEQLGAVLDAVAKDDGVLLVPAFAVGRTQELIYLLEQNRQRWKLDDWRLCVDGPLGIEATELYAQHAGLLAPGARAFAQGRGFRLPNLSFARTPVQSRALNTAGPRTLIIAGAGMCNGGRIQHHLKHRLWRPDTHVLMVGYQAPGTLGRRLLDGADTVRLWGEPVRVAARIHSLHGLSAHADADHLLGWYGRLPRRSPVALIHGEPPAMAALGHALCEAGAPRVITPRANDELDLASLS